jgi:hypothetical protein
MMIHQELLALGRNIQLHPALACLLAFVAPIAVAYWRFALLPYRRGERSALLSPRHVAQPAIPGVLERYASWEWVNEGHLTLFGRWVYDELARQGLSLAELARRAGTDVDAVMPLLYVQTGARPDPATIRTLAEHLGAGEHQIDRLVRAELTAEAEANRLP